MYVETATSAPSPLEPLRVRGVQHRLTKAWFTMWQHNQGHACGLCTSEPVKMQSFHMKAISHQPQAQFSPTEQRDGECYLHTIAMLPTSLSPLSSPWMRPQSTYTTTDVHVIICGGLHMSSACKPYTLKEDAPAPCTLVEESMQLIIKPLWLPGCS